jgi:predicted TIM-barrel fold metal-dependent hydrolase
MGEWEQLYERIKAAVDEIRMVDTHEHLSPESERNARTVDLFSEFFSHYASSDLVSAGWPEAELEWLRNVTVPLDERWAKFAPYWERMRRTAYARSLVIASQRLFGIEEISEGTYVELSCKISEANKPGWYRTVLKERSGIERSILDAGRTDCDRDFFKPVVRCDAFTDVMSRAKVRELERAHGVTVRGLDSLEQALEAYVAAKAGEDVAGIKISLAYQRPLRFDKTARADAERVLNRVLGGEFDKDRYLESQVSWAEAKPLQDLMVHKVIELAERHGLPVQIHTGLQEGCGNYVVNSRPTDLVNLFFEYPKCRFDLFHGSYPYSRELATLAKNFQNVYVDMCWMHIISPTASRAMLGEWLDMVPESKIMAFGGDYCFVEGVCGHAAMAREDVAKVLTKRVVMGSIGESEATAQAAKLLRTNAAELFGIAL